MGDLFLRPVRSGRLRQVGGHAMHGGHGRVSPLRKQGPVALPCDDPRQPHERDLIGNTHSSGRPILQPGCVNPPFRQDRACLSPGPFRYGTSPPWRTSGEGRWEKTPLRRQFPGGTRRRGRDILAPPSSGKQNGREVPSFRFACAGKEITPVKFIAPAPERPPEPDRLPSGGRRW